MASASFIIYNPTTGVISGAYTVTHSEAIASIMTGNTPAGMAALEVDPTESVVTNQRNWIVVDGVVTGLVPTDAALLAAAQAAQLAILQAAYNTAKAASVAYMSTAFMADPESQDMFAHAIEAYAVVGATPDGFFVVDAAYNKVPMTLDQLKGLITATSTQVWAVFQQWIAVRQALAAATTIDAVQAIVWT